MPRFAGPVDDLIAPIDQTLIDTRIGTGFGITALPHLQDMTIAGPMQVTGVSDTPSRRRVFTCRPTTAEERCATQIVQELGTKAYRGPLTAQDLDELMRFYQQGREAGGDFELKVLSTKPGTEKKWQELTVSELRVLGIANGAPENSAPDDFTMRLFAQVFALPPEPSAMRLGSKNVLCSTCTSARFGATAS